MAYSSMRRRSSFEHPPYATTPDEFYRCHNTMQYLPFENIALENSEKERFDLFKAIYNLLGPKLFFPTGLVIFVTAVARLVCPDLLG